jgi:hypothetical protein
MKRAYGFYEGRFSVDDVFDRLSRNRLGQKADEVTCVSRLKRGSDFAVRLEAA